MGRPLGASPLGSEPPAPFPLINEGDVYGIIRMAIEIADDESRFFIDRRRSARAATTAGLVYFMGFGPTKQPGLNVDVLDAIADGRRLVSSQIQPAVSLRARNRKPS